MKPQYHQKTIMEGIAEAEAERPSKSLIHLSSIREPMIDVKITTKIKIEKCGYMRKATFKAQFFEDNLVYNPHVDFTGVAKTVQGILHKIERQFRVKLTRDDFEFDYKLRKDETVEEWNNPESNIQNPVTSIQ